MRPDFEKLLLDKTPDALVATTTDGEVLYWNGAAEKIFGYTSTEAVGRPMSELIVPADLRGEEREISRKAMEHGFATCEALRQRKDGSLVYVELSLSPIETGEATLTMSAIRDITERKRFERRLQEKNVELENASRAKDRFLAAMSHELRTPLNAVLGFTGTLLMRLPGPLNADQERQLLTVQSSARQLLCLINDLLDLVKIESGKVELKLEPVVCQRVLEEVSSSLRHLAENKGLEFRLNAPESDLVLRTDRRVLSQILVNLLTNAIKFTERGSVSVELRRQPGPDGAAAEFSVKDTGDGVREADKAKLFQAFEQINASPNRRREGASLGLHLSQKFADLLGGRLSFESEWGKGSTFTLAIAEK